MNSLRYTDGSYLRASGTRDAFERASDHLVSEGHPPITVVSGDREYADQERIFRERYVLAGDVGGRRVYDTRVWNGVRWYRVSPAGTVAVPGTSNHESRRAADLGYPYNNRNTAAHRRLQQIAHLYGIKWTGVNFGEDWHWENTGPLGAVSIASSASVSTPEENTMSYPIEANGHRFLLAPGFIKHFTDVTASDLTKNIAAADDKWIKLDLKQLELQLDSFGIPRHVVDGNTGGVLNPVSQKIERGGMWSWARDAAAKGDRILAALAALSTTRAK